MLPSPRDEKHYPVRVAGNYVGRLSSNESLSTKIGGDMDAVATVEVGLSSPGLYPTRLLPNCCLKSRLTL